MIGGLGIGEVVFVLIVVLLLFGPNKIPELARAVGGALGEFKTAQKAAEFDLSGFDDLNREQAEKKKKEAAALDERIVQMATDAGISTEGKTTDELLVLISAKMNESNESAVSESESPSESENKCDSESESESENESDNVSALETDVGEKAAA
ncbi:Sec-independent protein translocase protein TatA [Methanimicrococcus hongohii]|uniref:Sec-independent protein translocase protein TatA n=1 Tax=Methanimicrococcus hongohii TaxID=3028295 RepID=A0AA96ZSA1_9EURY|nr:twin-arginine translocase TatA/TatE family subunit [Methanimicrococcus sp. Hf6]WNY23194.1 Sec-independent protein translocase protein TatA [Methanimicrococcus sp. Hf6]